MGRRHLEHVAIGHRLHLMDRMRRYAVRLAELESDIRWLAVASVLPHPIDDVAGEQIDRLVFHVMVLHRERLTGFDVQDLTDVRVGARPDRLMPPRFWNVRDVDGTRHALSVGRGAWSVARGASACTLHALRSKLNPL